MKQECAINNIPYKPSKDKYFLGSLPLGTVFKGYKTKGILLSKSVNVQVQIFHVDKLEVEADTKTWIGKKLWAWTTEVEIIKLGKIEEDSNGSDVLHSAFM